MEENEDFHKITFIVSCFFAGIVTGALLGSARTDIFGIALYCMALAYIIWFMRQDWQ